MAEFAFTHFISYLGRGDGALDPANGFNTRNDPLMDGDPDGTFETGDTVSAIPFSSTGAPSTGEYLGTAIVNGQEWPVFYFEATDESEVYLTEAPLAVPSTLQVDEGATFFDAPCFLSGTLIATPQGETAVEALKTGDEILTAAGGTVTVRWVGRQQVSSRFGPAGRLMPVRILAGALGEGLPLRDLTLTADHALLIDGVLVNAGALVNGSTVVSVSPAEYGEGYTVYHVETEDHQVILADGAPAETYIDYVGRQAFDNYAEYVALYGADRPIAEMREARITAARQLPPAIRARMAGARAA